MNGLCYFGLHRWKPVFRRRQKAVMATSVLIVPFGFEWRLMGAIPFLQQWRSAGHKCTRCGVRRQ